MNLCNSFIVAPYCMFLISYFTSQSSFRDASFSDEKVAILDDAELLCLNPELKEPWPERDAPGGSRQERLGWSELYTFAYLRPAAAFLTVSRTIKLRWSLM